MSDQCEQCSECEGYPLLAYRCTTCNGSGLVATVEYSNPTVTRTSDGHVTIDWSVKGWRQCTVVADFLIDEWIADRNRLADLEAKVKELADLLTPEVVKTT